jgi:hypothetical protein
MHFIGTKDLQFVRAAGEENTDSSTRAWRLGARFPAFHHDAGLVSPNPFTVGKTVRRCNSRSAPNTIGNSLQVNRIRVWRFWPGPCLSNGRSWATGIGHTGQDARPARARGNAGSIRLPEGWSTAMFMRAFTVYFFCSLLPLLTMAVQSARA